MRLESEFFFFYLCESTLLYSTSLPCGKEQTVYTNCFTRSFFIKRINSISNSDNFLIAKTFNYVLGDVFSVRKLRSGDLLVELSSNNQSRLLTNGKEMCSSFTFSHVHSILNYMCGVISELYLFTKNY